jgi:myb proto-oncogene protein
MREEDERLREAVELYGARWSKIAEAVGTRNGDQCWKRWYDCLDPRIDKSPWTAEEVCPPPPTRPQPQLLTLTIDDLSQDAKLLALVSQTGRNWSDIVHQHFPNRTSLAAKNRYSILRRKQERPSSRSSSVRRAKSKVNSATSTPSLCSSPYLGVPTTPSTSALSTPEPEFAPDDWMALTEAEIDELLYQSGHLSVGDGWHSSGTHTSASPSPQIGGDLELGTRDWSTGGSTQQSWMQPQPGFDSTVVDPQIQTTSAAGYDGYYAQGQPTEAMGYGYNMTGMYHNNAQTLPHQGLYDTSGGLISQGGMGQWQGGYTTGSW